MLSHFNISVCKILSRLDVSRQVCTYFDGQSGECLANVLPCLTQGEAERRRAQDRNMLDKLVLDNRGILGTKEDLGERCTKLKKRRKLYGR